MTAIRLGLVVPTLDNFRGLAEMLESVRSRHPWTPFIVPNWRNGWCVSRSWNDGLRRAFAAGCDIALVVNDDVLFAPQAVDEVVTLLGRSSDDVVLVSADNVRDNLASPQDILEYATATESVVDAPDFSCFAVRPDVLERIGLFDEGFRPAYFEDNDYHYRIRLAGARAVRTSLAPYVHFGSRTQNGPCGPIVTSQAFEANRAYYTGKWGGRPGEETYSTPWNGAQGLARSGA